MLYQPNALAALWNINALRVSVKLLRLRRALFTAGYDASQPRAPAGSAIGGQWVGAGTADRVHVAVSAFDNPGLYYVDLAEEEDKGGHGYSKHVGMSSGYLKAYVIAWNMNPINELHPAEGSFHSLGEANNLVAAALRANPDVVQAAILGGKNLQILHRFGYDTGYEAYQPSVQVPPIIRTTYWVEIYITNDPRSGGKGYRVVTAYPMNEIPNETTRKHMELMEL